MQDWQYSERFSILITPLNVMLLENEAVLSV